MGGAGAAGGGVSPGRGGAAGQPAADGLGHRLAAPERGEVARRPPEGDRGAGHLAAVDLRQPHRRPQPRCHRHLLAQIMSPELRSWTRIRLEWCGRACFEAAGRRRRRDASA